MASSIAHSINGDEGGGKNRAESREFIKKSNRASENPGQKVLSEQKRKEQGVSRDLPWCKADKQKEILPKSGKWNNGIAPRTKNCQKAPLIKDTQFLRSETAVNPQKTDRNSGSPFFIVRSVCLSDPPSAETGCLRVCHCNLMLWLKQNGVRLLHLELVVVGH